VVGHATLIRAKKIHDELKTRGLLLEKDIMLGTALVDMYAKCGFPAKAHEVLDELPIRNIVSWSAIIVGYVQQGQAKETLDCFERMLNEGLSSNAVTFSCLLKPFEEKGEEIHERIVKLGALKKDIVLGTALVDMYAKCGKLAKAHQVLGELPNQSVATWNALIAGHAQEGQCDQAMNCLEKIQDEGISPNVVTFICIMKSCGTTIDVVLFLISENQTGKQSINQASKQESKQASNGYLIKG
jgi:pentatricopeptide repeat protein